MELSVRAAVTAIVKQIWSTHHFVLHHTTVVLLLDCSSKYDGSDVTHSKNLYNQIILHLYSKINAINTVL